MILSFTYNETVKQFPEETLVNFGAKPDLITAIDAGTAAVVLAVRASNLSARFPETPKPDVSGSYDVTIRVYDADTAQLGADLTSASNVITAPHTFTDEVELISFTAPVGARSVVVYSADGTDLVWEGPNTGDLYSRLDIDVEGVYVSPDGSTDSIEAILSDSVEAGLGIQADWDEADPGAASYIRNKPDVSDAGEANVQANWTETNQLEDAYIRNKPTTITTAERLKLASVEDNAAADQTGAEIVDAIDTQLGNDNWQMAGGGGGGGDDNVQSDWTESNTGSDSFIQNKPPTITDAQTAKLAAIEPMATTDQTGDEIATSLDSAIGTVWRTGGSTDPTETTADLFDFKRTWVLPDTEEPDTASWEAVDGEAGVYTQTWTVLPGSEDTNMDITFRTNNFSAATMHGGMVLEFSGGGRSSYHVTLTRNLTIGTQNFPIQRTLATTAGVHTHIDFNEFSGEGVLPNDLVLSGRMSITFTMRIASEGNDLLSAPTVQDFSYEGAGYLGHSITLMSLKSSIFTSINGATVTSIDVGPPTDVVPTGAGEFVVDNSGKLWVSGDEVVIHTVPPTITRTNISNASFPFWNNAHTVRPNAVQTQAGHFYWNTNYNTFEQNRGPDGILRRTWRQCIAYLEDNSQTVPNTAASTQFLGHLANQTVAAEALVRKSDRDADNYVYIDETNYGLYRITGYTEGTVTREEHLFWRDYGITMAEARALSQAIADAAAETAAEARYTDAEKTKLASVEADATSDQTGSEIVSRINTQLGNSDWQMGGTGGEGGTVVAANPSGEDGDNLDRITIGGVNFNIPGAQEFTDLTDTPSTYTAQARKLLRINTDEDAVEFINEPEPTNPIGSVAELPTPDADSPNMVFLTHDYTKGLKRDASLTVGFNGGIAGFTGEHGTPANIGSVSLPGPGPMAALIGIGTATGYRLHDLYSFNRAWLDSLTAIELGGEEYMLGVLLHENGVYFRRIANFPENHTAATLSLNFYRTDEWYFTDGTDTLHTAGLYEKTQVGDFLEYRKLIFEGLVHIDGTGAPENPPTRAAQTYVNNLGKVWISGDQVETTDDPPEIVRDETFGFVHNNIDLYVFNVLGFETIYNRADGAFALATNNDVFVQRQGAANVNSIVHLNSWEQVWSYIVSDVIDNASTRHFRDNTSYLGKFGTKEEAALAIHDELGSETFAQNTFFYALSSDSTIRKVLEYNPGTIIREDHFFWDGPLTSETDVSSQLNFNIKKLTIGGAPINKPDFAGQIAINDRGQIYTAGGRIVQHPAASTWTASQVSTVVERDSTWPRWQGAHNHNITTGATANFYWRSVENTFKIYTADTVESSLTWDGILDYFIANPTLAANSPTGLLPLTGPRSIFVAGDSFVFNSDNEAANYVRTHYFTESTSSPMLWLLSTGGGGPETWDLRLAQAGALVDGGLVDEEEFYWTGPVARNLTDLDDVPSVLGSPGETLIVNSDRTGTEFGVVQGLGGADRTALDELLKRHPVDVDFSVLRFSNDYGFRASGTPTYGTGPADRPTNIHGLYWHNNPVDTDRNRRFVLEVDEGSSSRHYQGAKLRVNGHAFNLEYFRRRGSFNDYRTTTQTGANGTLPTVTHHRTWTFNIEDTGEEDVDYLGGTAWWYSLTPEHVIDPGSSTAPEVLVNLTDSVTTVNNRITHVQFSRVLAATDDIKALHIYSEDTNGNGGSGVIPAHVWRNGSNGVTNTFPTSDSWSYLGSVGWGYTAWPITGGIAIGGRNENAPVPTSIEVTLR